MQNSTSLKILGNKQKIFAGFIILDNMLLIS